MANPVVLSGAETGGTSEITTVTGTVTADNSAGNFNPLGGTYSYKMGTTSAIAAFTVASTGPTYFQRCWFMLNPSVNWGSGAFNDFANASNSGSFGPGFRILFDGTNYQLQYLGSSAFNQKGSNLQITLNTWYCIEVGVTMAAAGTCTWYVNGAAQTTFSGDTRPGGGFTAVTTFSFGAFNTSGTTTAPSLWIDDICVRTDQLCGVGALIARQPNATTPNYNAWTKSTGTTISACWNTTPFSATTNASDSTASAAQTGVADFTITGGTGSTGFGSGVIATGAVINGMKVCGVGKTSNTTTDAGDQWRFRTPAGAGGSDTTGAAFLKFTTGDTYRETILNTPTTAQAQDCEYGIVKTATGSRTHTIEDAWVMIDFVPPAIVGFARGTLHLHPRIQAHKPSAPFEFRHFRQAVSAAVVTGSAVRAKTKQSSIRPYLRKRPKIDRKPRAAIFWIARHPRTRRPAIAHRPKPYKQRFWRSLQLGVTSFLLRRIKQRRKPALSPRKPAQLHSRRAEPAILARALRLRQARKSALPSHKPAKLRGRRTESAILARTLRLRQLRKPAKPPARKLAPRIRRIGTIIVAAVVSNARRELYLRFRKPAGQPVRKPAPRARRIGTIIVAAVVSNARRALSRRPPTAIKPTKRLVKRATRSIIQIVVSVVDAIVVWRRRGGY